MADRFDVSIVKKWKLDKRDRLIVEATPTKSGVFTYHEPDNMGGFKQVRELRHPDDVFSRETLDSLNGIPYTTQSNHVSLMRPETVREKTYGFTLQNAKRVDNHAQVSIKINDKAEIDAVTGGQSLELSNGYTCDIEKETGEFEGERYDQRQKNIIYDHVARVEKARGGESCRIRLDSECAICGVEAERLDSGVAETSHDEEIMTEKNKEVVLEREFPERSAGDFRLDAETVSVPKEHSNILDIAKGRETKLFAEIERVNTAGVENQVKLDSAEKKVLDLEKKLENTIPADRLDSEIDSRLNLWDMAKEQGVEGYKTMSQKELSIEVLKGSKMYDEAKFDSAEYVAFAIDHLSSDRAKNVARSRKNLESHQGAKFDSFDDDSSKPSRLEVS